MKIALTLLFFLFGSVFGSFFNVVGLRLPQKKSFISNRSICPACERTLSASELIPLLSILLLQGKCKACHKKLSPLYPIIELTTGSSFAFSYMMIGFHAELIIAFHIVSTLMVPFVPDLLYLLTP